MKKDTIRFLFPNLYEDMIKDFIFDDINFKIFLRKNNKEKKIQVEKNKIYIIYRKKRLLVNRLFYLFYNKELPEIVIYKNGNIFDLSKDNLIAETSANHIKKLLHTIKNISKTRKKDPFVRLMKNLKRAGQKGRKRNIVKEVSKNINKSILKDIFNKQNGRCYWLKVKLDPEANLEPNHPLALSIDRIDNDRGYEINNIVISSRLANLGRGCFSAEKMKIICENLLDKIRNNE